MPNNYFTIQENYKERFYQIPKVFFTNEQYKKLSNDTKIAYGILRDRVELSIKNNWVDDLGNIYFIYTVKHLEIILNCGNKKVIKIKNELEEAGLLEQKRLGLNKPNMLYLKKPIITQKDIYIIDNYENNLKNNDKFNNTTEVSKRHFQKCQNDTSKNVKTTPQEMSKQHSNDTDINDTDINDTDINTTTTKKTAKSGSSGEKYLIKLLREEITVRPTKAFIEKITSLSINMSDELVEYAIKYASENGNNPKQYLAKILEVWSNNHIYDLKQAQNFNVNSNINSLKSKEKTPRWITHPDEFKLKEENDQELEIEAQAFKDHLTKKRRNYKE
ncbi:replication initiator protein A [Staphylococcus agnetis]|uniref:replication initiator protein A n=1 Tax=Staphylococcus agnetis TaxID=985762 RepID=UPI00208FC228|nr:replication initiator protein A [Staphylococcus agnetis]MCO4327841.1 replication initiator protein A [Staphylococcus agnetis]MCO4353682.1 replication initiator protein A [Staphylococcus agnetis]MCO4370238.1 replication initiator protein A [Staphylococcus agnetis]